MIVTLPRTSAVRRAAVLVLAALLIVGSVAPAAAQVSGGDGHRPIEDPLFEVTSVVPASWQELGGGLYGRGQPPDDPSVIAIQSVPMAPAELWPGLLPQLGLTEVPAATGAHEGEALDWTLHAFDVSVPGIELRVEVALAEEGGRTYLVLLQSAPEEFAALREQVLVPALDATAPLVPEPTPHPSTFDYAIEEVTFPGGSPGVELAGTLTLPSGPGPHPVVVTMSGSGPQDRDESLKPITTLKPFAILADALTSAGVGVLRYDDRGVGGSSGDHAAATVDDLAGDAAAAIDYLETRSDVDPARIGLLGHSEGGIYAAMIGADDPRVAFIVGMAPAVVDGIDLIVAQNEALARASGADEVEVEARRAYTAAVMPLVLEGDWDAAEQVTRDYVGGIWDRLSEQDRAVLGEREAFISAQVAQVTPAYGSDWFRSLLAHDSQPDWARVTVPVLGLFGALDAQVVTEQNEPALRAALEAAGNEDVETIVFPDANHLFQSAGTGAFEEYGSLAPEFTDGFVEAVVDWVSERAGVAG